MNDKCQRCGVELPPRKTNRRTNCVNCSRIIKLEQYRQRYAEKGRASRSQKGVKCIKENSVYAEGHYYNESYVRADIRAGLVPEEAFAL